MASLSITASIIAVLQLTTSIIAYCNDVSPASTDQKRVAFEACNLTVLLTNLRYKVEDAHSDDEWLNQVKQLGIEHGPLEQLHGTLERMVRHINKYKRKKEQSKSALARIFDSTSVDTALQQMDRLKSLIQLALLNDTFRLSQAIEHDVTHLNTLPQQVPTGIEQLHLHAEQGLQEKLSSWLRVADPSTNYHAALKKRHSGTGKWLLEAQAYQDWKSARPSLLWLHGEAGCGKTVVSATALETILLETSDQRNTVVAYFYFDFSDTNKQSSSAMIRSLLFQFALKLPDGLRELEQLYQSDSKERQSLSDSQAFALLLYFIGQAKRTYIVLDALDECLDREELLNLVKSLKTAPQRNVRLLTTSSRSEELYISLSLVADQIINIQSSVINPDIDTYIRDQLHADQKLQKWSPSIKEEILSVLTEKANGMFQWVYCQLEDLRKCYQLKALRKAFSELPKNLNDTYTRTLHNIESNDVLPDAIKVLQWLCFSDRPLRLVELVDILAIEQREDGSAAFDPAHRMPDPEDIMQLCSGLVSYHKWTKDEDLPDVKETVANHDSYDTDALTVINTLPRNIMWVQLSHFSVKEYLLSEHCYLLSEHCYLLSEHCYRNTDFQPALCHVMITTTCLIYLQHLTKTMREEELDTNPLTDYCVLYWWQHAQQCPTSTELTDTVYKFLANERHLLTWLRLYDVDNSRLERNFSQALENLAPPLYYAALIGLTQVVQKFVQEGVDVNAQGGRYLNTIQAASARGHEKIVLILIEAKADVNVQGGEYGNALQAASARGHSEVVQMLLAAGADIGLQQAGPEGNALYAAAAGGHEKVVHMLLEAKVDANVQGGRYANALQAASAGGHDRVVQMLLDMNTDVNMQGGVYGNALQAASAGGHDRVVYMLITAKANVNAQKGQYGNALYAASTGGYDKVVHMLLEAKANVNAQGGWYSNHGTSLQAAAAGGHDKVVQQLLKANANVNALRGRYGNALYAAASRGHERIVRMLLEAKAHVNVQGGVHSNALQAASAGGYEKVVQMLLEAKASVNAQGGRYGSALYAAAASGHDRVVRLLLKGKADPNVSGGHYGNPLQAAAAGGYDKVVQILLNARADITNQGGIHGNALQAASVGGHERVVQILLEAQADVNAPKGMTGNALYAASAAGHDEVVQMLLNAKADIIAKGGWSGNQGNALEAASAAGHNKVVQMLLDAQADGNLPDDEYGNTAQDLPEGGHQQTMQRLVKQRMRKLMAQRASAKPQPSRTRPSG